MSPALANTPDEHMHQPLKQQKDYSWLYNKMVEEVEDYAILFIDTKGIIKNWNKGAEKIKGYTSQEIVGKNFRLFYTKQDKKQKLPDKLLEEAMLTGHALQEGWRVRKDGTRFWGSIAITPVHEENKKVIGYTKVTRDLTDIKKAEENIRMAIVDAQEKERNELSAVLHDNVSQILVASSLFIHEAEKKCRNEFLKMGKKHVNLAINEIRNLSHQLDPSSELDLGLQVAIQKLLKDINKLHKIHFSFSQTGSKLKMKPEIGKLLFRIIQEQVSNILKHSEASKASIQLRWHKKNVTVIVTDNGKGFIVHEVKKGLGLQNIIYRAETYEGSAGIQSSPGHGCTIRVIIPIQ